MNELNKTVVITQAEVDKYAHLTGDFNPIHFDKDFASKTLFKEPIIHGPLLLTKITTIFANEYPGSGSVYLGHSYKFLKPVYVGEDIKIKISLIEINEKNHLIVSTKCFNKKGELVFDGTATLKKF